MQPLHIACERGFASCVKVLIEECHADPNCEAEVFDVVFTLYKYIHTLCV